MSYCSKIYLDDYWLGSAAANGYVWRMTEVGSYGWVQSNYNHPYSNASVFGVRPVIVI